MRKDEREALQKFMNRFGTIREEKDKIFHDLQDLCRKNGKTIWCSAEDNMQELQDTPDAERATDLYNRYWFYEGQYDLIGDYGTMLAEMDFWKSRKRG